jgi:hypothetical protein
MLFVQLILVSVYRLVLVAMGFCPVVDVSMVSIHSGFPIGAQLAFPASSPSGETDFCFLFPCLCVCKELCIFVKQLMERGSAQLEYLKQNGIKHLDIDNYKIY